MTGAPATYFEAERLAVFDRHVGGVEKLNEDVRGADLRRARRKASAPRSALASVGITATWIWHPAAGGDSVGSAGERVRASPACGHRQRPRLPT